MRAPTRSYAPSANALPTPAPVSISTSWPRLISSSAPCGRQRDAVLVGLDLFRDTDPHGARTLSGCARVDTVSAQMCQTDAVTIAVGGGFGVPRGERDLSRSRPKEQGHAMRSFANTPGREGGGEELRVLFRAASHVRQGQVLRRPRATRAGRAVRARAAPRGTAAAPPPCGANGRGAGDARPRRRRAARRSAGRRAQRPRSRPAPPRRRRGRSRSPCRRFPGRSRTRRLRRRVTCTTRAPSRRSPPAPRRRTVRPRRPARSDRARGGRVRRPTARSGIAPPASWT